jgi:hypothetical protein
LSCLVMFCLALPCLGLSDPVMSFLVMVILACLSLS